jgi:hypothetical protein
MLLLLLLLLLLLTAPPPASSRRSKAASARRSHRPPLPTATGPDVTSARWLTGMARDGSLPVATPSNRWCMLQGPGHRAHRYILIHGNNGRCR